MRLLASYRSTGADPPFGDPLGAHPGVALEGWFWRASDPMSGRVVIAILGVTRPADGPAWGMVSLATAPGTAVRTASGPLLRAATRGLDLEVGDGLLRAGPDALDVDLGKGARAALRWTAPVRWPRPAFGGVGPAHWVPGLSQYWHPWLLGASVSGEVALDGDAFALGGARMYAEKNWGRGGMPPAWWWGQANAFPDPAVGVCFAGGQAGLGRVQVPAGALVVRLGDRLTHVVRPPFPLRTTAEQKVPDPFCSVRGGGVEIEGWVEAGSSPHWLPVPVPGTREHRWAHTPQHLAGTLQLTVRRRGRTVYRGESALAGLESGRGLPSRP